MAMYVAAAAMFASWNCMHRVVFMLFKTKRPRLRPRLQTKTTDHQAQDLLLWSKTLDQDLGPRPRPWSKVLDQNLYQDLDQHIGPRPKPWTKTETKSKTKTKTKTRDQETKRSRPRLRQGTKTRKDHYRGERAWLRLRLRPRPRPVEKDNKRPRPGPESKTKIKAKKQEERRNKWPICHKGPRSLGNQLCLVPVVLVDDRFYEPVNVRVWELNGQLESNGVQQDTLADLQKDAYIHARKNKSIHTCKEELKTNQNSLLQVR